MNQASIKGDYGEAYYGEQTYWFCQTGKCDVVELFTGSTGLSWHMPRLHMKVGEPIDYKHGWSFNSKTKRNQVLKQLEKIEPKFVLINNHQMPGTNRSTSIALT